MATVIKSFSIDGIDAIPIQIQTIIAKGVPRLTIIGLGDQAVIEAGERVRAAIEHFGYFFPASRITVSLAPGDLKKGGSHYDLGMAVSILHQSGQIKSDSLEQYAFIGELSLNGILSPCKGVLPMMIQAKRFGISKIILPPENLQEARLISGIQTFGFNDLQEIALFLDGKKPYQEPDLPSDRQETVVSPRPLDFSEVKGQNDLITAIVLGVAGSHNILMIGEPGCGKTMIAERIPTIIPTMTEDESLDITKIHSVTGILPPGSGLLTQRPFRAPHHNASLNSIIGGGNPAQPGEVSLAHNGVLFLDELPEFPRSVLEALRLPLENRKVTIARVNGTHTYPANFMLVAAMNPCPCGYHPSRRCRCSDYEIKQYRSKISGPILDRIDIQKRVRPVNLLDLGKQPASYSSAMLRERVEVAREVQKKRFANEPGIYCNAQMPSSMIEQYCKINSESEQLLRKATEENFYSARVINKLLKLARTSADLSGSDDIRRKDIEIVLSCRDLDNSIRNGYTL